MKKFADSFLDMITQTGELQSYAWGKFQRKRPITTSTFPTHTTKNIKEVIFALLIIS